MCELSSSAISRLRWSARKTLAMRDSSDMSGLPENAIDCHADRLPARFFGAELLLACGGQFVDAGAAASVFPDPLSANPACLFHAIERGVERAFFRAQHLAGCVGDCRHDGIAMKARPP